MAGVIKTAVVSGVLSTSGTGTLDLTKSGFGTVVGVRIILSWDLTDDGNDLPESRASIGFSDFTNHRCISHQDEDAVPDANCDAIKSVTKAYLILDGSGSVIIDGNPSAITDGVRLTNTTNTGGDAVFVTAILYGGADIAVSIGSITINSTIGNTATGSHSGLTDGNEKLAYFIGTDIDAEDTVDTGIESSFGVCHISGSDGGGYTLTQACIGWTSENAAAAAVATSVIENDRCLSILTTAGAQDWAIEVTAFSSSGGTITVTTRDVSPGTGIEIYFFLIDLDDKKAKVGTVSLPVSGTSWSPAVSLGFVPQYVDMGLTAINNGFGSAETNNSAAPTGISIVTGSGEEACHTWYNHDNTASMDTNSKFKSRAIDLENGAGVIVYELNFTSFESGGWTYNIDTNAVSDYKTFYSSIEEGAVGGISIPVVQHHRAMQGVF